MKYIVRMFFGALLVLSLAGCAQDKGASKGRNVEVVLKAMDSEFWQSMATGAKKYAEKNPGVTVTISGPPTEADIAQGVAILENVVSKSPAGILIAPANATAPLNPIKQALAAGIPVVTADNSVETEVTAHIATDNLIGGADAAVAFVKALQAKGQKLEGTVAIISPDVFEVITKRENGFKDKLKELAPNIKILGPRYCDNDIAKALSIAQDIMLSTKNLIGFYGANNHSADGIVRAVRESKRTDLAFVAYDSDPEEVKALADRIIDALIVQDPWALGYLGVENIIKKLDGKPVDSYINPGVATITPDNMNTPKMKALLDPKIREEY